MSQPIRLDAESVDVVISEGTDLALTCVESTPTYFAIGATVVADVYSAADRSTSLLSLTCSISPSGTLTITKDHAAILSALGLGRRVWRVHSSLGGVDRTVWSGSFTVKAKVP